jgi:cell fate regulator YaaT (PSP1 superfamily)
MPTVVGVQFKSVTKVYHFDPNGMLGLTASDYVVVDTARGPEVAQVIQPPHQITENDVVGEMKPVLRRASAWDMVQRDMWQHKEQEALAICRAKAAEHHLNIKMVRCEYSFDGGRLLVYFASEDRVDFRSLVRELARIFHTRIEMRQIGVRDEAKLLDGVGKCGRQLCCTSWLREFTPVSIRMAKNQQLPLNQRRVWPIAVLPIVRRRTLSRAKQEDAETRRRSRDSAWPRPCPSYSPAQRDRHCDVGKPCPG